MQADQTTGSRPRGRPRRYTDAEVKARVIRAATGEFAVEGFANTKVGDVARQAGISTRRFYGLFGSKDELLREIVHKCIAERLRSFDPDRIVGQSFEDTLCRILSSYGTIALAKETVLLMRLLVGQADKFSDELKIFYDLAVDTPRAKIANWILHSGAGRIAASDAVVLASGLQAKVVLDAYLAILLHLRKVPEHREICVMAREAVSSVVGQDHGRV